MFEDAAWKKSSRSDGQGANCVEIAIMTDTVGVRDSKNRRGAVLAYTADEWTAFLAGVKAGEFDR
ncbi:DUF397 domain-containing protein [Catellatospora sp. NPDC049133]|uniref:DUF397 domain-containing protein n=1 Tax=Catellatospora sp. NPDC049133 TaxID=3155499 RepID=UPI0033FE7765